LQVLILSVLITLRAETQETKILFLYLFNEDGSQKIDFVKKAWQLSVRLSRNFLAYELYRSEMISSWRSGRLVYASEMEKAQRFIYMALFGSDGFVPRSGIFEGTLTQYLEKNFNKIVIAPLNIDSVPEIIFFGKTLLSPFHVKSIYSLGKFLNISIYQLNPCVEFWEDVTTPAEDRWQRIKSIRIIESPEGEVLSENENENPLLKLWGKPGRESVKLLGMLEEAGSREMSFESQWLEEDDKHGRDSLLGKIQDQILHRSSSDIIKVRQDESLQIIECPDIYREVESVYHSILFNLMNDKTLRMTDIAVMVPDMEQYEPVIKSVFSRKSGKISYSLIDTNTLRESSFGKALKSFFTLAGGTFSRKDVFDLVMNPCFMEAVGITTEDALLWLEWADRLNIYHNINGSEYELFTWDWGLLRLRLGRIMEMQTADSAENFAHYMGMIPYQDINVTAEKLSVLSIVVGRIIAEINAIKNARMNGREWKNVIERLISQFFAITDDREEEHYVYNGILESLKKLEMIDHIRSDHSPKFTIELIREYVLDNLKNIPGSYGNYLTSGINISALVPKRQIPFRIIYILGMGEGLFPGSSDYSSVDLRNLKRKIGDISRTDANRYLFLETVISTREKMYISYVSRDLQKDQVFYHNSIIGQLVSYLENHILSEKFNILQVPVAGWSGRYLEYDREKLSGTDFLFYSDNKRFFPINFSAHDRTVMYAHALKENREMNVDTQMLRKKIDEITETMLPVFSEVRDETLRDDDDHVIINLRDLRLYLKNPAESAVRRHLQLYDDSGITVNEDEPLFSEYFNKRDFIRDILHRYICSPDDFDYKSCVKELYHNQFLSGNAAGKSFYHNDLNNYIEAVSARIEKGAQNLSSFKYSRRNHQYFKDIIIGDSDYGNGKNGIFSDDLTKNFTPFTMKIKTGEDFKTFEIKATINNIWKDRETGDIELLLITASSQFNYSQIIYPFLFCIMAKSGFHKELYETLGKGNFIIHVSHRNKMTSVPYAISRESAATYFSGIINDFSQDKSFDFLPLEIISEDRMRKRFNEMKNPGRDEKSFYREILVQRIKEDAESYFPKYSPGEIITLMSPNVPEDAYDKVKTRLSLLLNPQIVIENE